VATRKGGHTQAVPAAHATCRQRYLNHEHDRLTRTLGRIEAVGKELNRLADA